MASEASVITSCEHPFIQVWPTIKPRLHRIIKAFLKLKDVWVGMRASRPFVTFRSQQWTSKPIKVEVIIDRFEPYDWVVPARRIREVLDLNGCEDVQVEYESLDCKIER